MSAIGVYAASAVTAVTAQNTLGVDGVQGIDPDMVVRQIDAVFSDLRPDAVKIRMLYSRASWRRLPTGSATGVRKTWCSTL